jgi:hypothetical protein
MKNEVPEVVQNTNNIQYFSIYFFYGAEEYIFRKPVLDQRRENMIKNFIL